MSSIALPSDDSTSSLSAHHQPTDPFPRPTTDRPKSTGPRTPAGKKASSQNARKHNLSAATPPPSLRANLTYQLLRDELKEEFRPITPAQSIFVDQLTFVSWKLDQIPHLERQLLATPIGQTTPTPLQDPPRIIPNDDDDESIDSANDTDTTPPPKDPTNDLTATHLLQDKATPLTRLWDHHRRLLARFQSLVRQIHQLQKHETARMEKEAGIESDRERSRRLARDKAILDEEVNRMRERNRQRDEDARRQRMKENQSTSSPPLTPSPGTPGKYRGDRSPQTHIAPIANPPLTPSPGTPGEGWGEGPSRTNTPPLATPLSQSLAVSRTNTAPIPIPPPTPVPTNALAQNELPPPVPSTITLTP